MRRFHAVSTHCGPRVCVRECVCVSVRVCMRVCMHASPLHFVYIVQAGNNRFCEFDTGYRRTNELLISLSVSVFVSLSVTHTARDLGRSALFFFCGLSFLSSIFPRQINPHGGKMKLCEKMFRPNKVMLPKRDCAMFA